MGRKTFYIILVLAFAVITQGKAQALEVDSPVSEKLSIYGFGAFHFCKTEKDDAFISKRQSYLECSKGGSFAQWIMTPFFDFQITERLRALLSFELQYAPSFKFFSDEITKGEAFGKFDIHFAFIEYMFHQLATLRAGRFHLPLGLFGEAMHTPIYYPFLFLPKVQLGWFPHYDTAIQLRGETSFLKYTFQVGNGQGVPGGIIDKNQDKSLLGTLFFRVPSGNLFGSLIGVSAYRYENSKTQKKTTVLLGHTLLNLLNVVPGKIQLIGEVSYKTENGTKSIGYYVVPNYTFSISKLAITPYIIYDFADYDLDDKGKGDVTYIGGGINFSPIPQLIIKTEILHESNNEKGDLKKQLIIGGGIIYAF
jgi:hypothetical protein